MGLFRAKRDRDPGDEGQKTGPGSHSQAADQLRPAVSDLAPLPAEERDGGADRQA